MYITASAGRSNKVESMEYVEPKKKRRKKGVKRKQYRYFQDENRRMKIEQANESQINSLLMTLAQNHVQSGNARKIIAESVSNLAIEDRCNELEE